jgi:short subunit dehydrogenase-like uncharacterized protein
MTATNSGKTRLLLYGAYGYTGHLTAEIAAARKLQVVLAGRNKAALVALGNQLNLSTRAVGLNDATQLREALRDIACVVHMAGPFAATSAPMLNACLATQTNYVDITGEIEVFEAMWSQKTEVRRAGITAIPGAGFDVVPTDCLAGYVADKLEKPISLVIALRGLQTASQGTLRTAIRQISNPVLCRRAGTIVALEDRSTRWIDFGRGDEPCVPLSWGDVSTAFYSTDVGNPCLFQAHETSSLSRYGRKAAWTIPSQPAWPTSTSRDCSRVTRRTQPITENCPTIHDLGGSNQCFGEFF